MKQFLNIAASVLLICNGAGALFGGWNLMLYPDGSSIQLSMDWLKHTPFPDYRIPGVILFTAIGLFSVVAFFALLLKTARYPLLVLLQGVLLTGWIIIQMALIRTVDFLHILFGAIGIVLMIVGWKLIQYDQQAAAHD